MGKRKQNIQEKHERIIGSATKHFATHGFEGTKMANVAQDADVAVGTIYLRYPNKSALLTGVLDHYEDVFVNAMSKDQITKIQWPDRFEAMFGSLMETARDIEHIGPIMALSSHSHIHGHIRGAKIRSEIKVNIEKGKNDGVFKSGIDASIAASIAYSMVDGAMMHMMLKPDTDPSLVIGHLCDACTSWMMNP